MASRYLTRRQFWCCAIALWACVLIAMSQLDGLDRVLATIATTAGWVALTIERYRNWRDHR